MNILGNAFDLPRLLHVFWILNELFLGLVHASYDVNVRRLLEVSRSLHAAYIHGSSRLVILQK